MAEEPRAAAHPRWFHQSLRPWETRSSAPVVCTKSWWEGRERALPLQPGLPSPAPACMQQGCPGLWEQAGTATLVAEGALGKAGSKLAPCVPLRTERYQTGLKPVFKTKFLVLFYPQIPSQAVQKQPARTAPTLQGLNEHLSVSVLDAFNLKNYQNQFLMLLHQVLPPQLKGKYISLCACHCAAPPCAISASRLMAKERNSHLSTSAPAHTCITHQPFGLTALGQPFIKSETAWKKICFSFQITP